MSGSTDPVPGGSGVARGYSSPNYRDSFRDFGSVVTLPRSGLHLIKRVIEGTYFDLLGLYPYSCCTSWGGLTDDLKDLRSSGAVSIALVADPFEQQAAGKEMEFWDICKLFKTHWVVDLHSDWRARQSKNTRYYARRALRRQKTIIIEDGAEHAAAFWALYQVSAERLGMTGIQRFSPRIIQAQLELEDAFLVMARTADGATGAMIVIDSGEVANIHLIGLSDQGHQLDTSYALTQKALEHLESRGRRYVNLGGTAGLVDDPEAGLSRFKRRWANTCRTALFGGCVLAPAAYRGFERRSGIADTDFFPAYRAQGSLFFWQPVVGPSVDGTDAVQPE